MRIFLMTLVLASTFSITAFAGTPGEVTIDGYLREATLDGLNAKSKTFSDYKGKPLIINVWASWCGPCRMEMASLERLASRYNGKEFNVIGVSTDDYRDKAEAFIKQTGITFENYMDHKVVLEHMLGATTIPLTVLVDAQGRILNKVDGSREWDNPAIIDAIAATFQIKLAH
jgi:thiol-disulfide isomerase/thioredoxin